jgi:uncharacterized protein (TIGR01370 family)
MKWVSWKGKLCLNLGVVFCLSVCGSLVPTLQASNNHRSFAVYYSDEADSSAFEEFDLLIFDSDSYPQLNPLADRGKTLLGYLSLGEVEQYRTYFQAVKREGILLQENPYWKGSYFVDIRSPGWTSRVIERLVPRILRRGFHGLFLDTLDNPAHLERVDPQKFKGMVLAAANLVKTIRYHYPSIKIMLNRAYEILPHVEGEIDMVLGESVFADYDFETKRYKRVPRDLYQYQVNLLKGAQKRTPALQIFTLDYWDPGDSQAIREIYSEQRGNGFVPYVATVELDVLVPEPKP